MTQPTRSSLAAQEMRAGPSDPDCRIRVQTTASCAGITVGVVSVAEKAGITRQVRAGKTNASEPLMTCRKRWDCRRNQAPVVGMGRSSEGACRLAERRPAWRRRETSERLLCGTWEPAASMPREISKRQNREEPSTDAGRRDGRVRSSDEAR